MKRYVTIWFRHLTTDQVVLRQPDLAEVPFVLAAPERGRMVVRAASVKAEKSGIRTGMVVADARAVLPSLLVMDEDPEAGPQLLEALGQWTFRFTPLTALDPPDGLVLDATGCCHLWGGEVAYLKDILTRLRRFGYDVRAAMADTIATAWAVTRHSNAHPIVEPNHQADALLALPPAALRLEPLTVEKMHKVGFYKIKNFIHIPYSVLRRRFGQELLNRLGQALGQLHEPFDPIQPVQPYQERLPCMEPILTATGIEIAIKMLLETLCSRLLKEGKGLRKAVLTCYRIDGETRQAEIGTSGPSCSSGHLFKLFELKIHTIEPALGIELFQLDATAVEDLPEEQETLWNITSSKSTLITQLLDRLISRAGPEIIHRHLPAEHYWPERSFVEAATLTDQPLTVWRTDRPRPIHLLTVPERILVTAPEPDYPPILFKYKGNVHLIQRADGPERIEQEWWLEDGLHRDYYTVEDQSGARFWVFRLGHYDDQDFPDWFIHGFFA